MPSTPAVFRIVPTAQNYGWGKIGRNSSVAQFAEESKLPGFTVDEGSPYAELWMGTHLKSPSHVLSSGEKLSSYLAAHPELIGTSIIEKFKAEGAGEGNLPFLFKVLSIEMALSIQTHPDKKTAEELHKQQPDIYKDPNHKPEMALAITPFEAMCGFRPLPEIAAFLSRTPELEALIPPSILSSFLTLSNSTSPDGPQEKVALKNVFAALMTAADEELKLHLAKLLKRYGSGVGEEDKEIAGLVTRLASQFPGDIGAFCPFLLNFIKLEPGQAIFLGAGEPHAYVSGECIECMANSDNVIRAGLTQKLRDVPNLVAGLTYHAAPSSNHIVEVIPLPSAPSSTLYDPPIPEFAVIQTIIPTKDGKKQAAHPPLEGPSLAIVTEGKGLVTWGESEKLDIGRGDVFFVGAATAVEFEGEHLVIYRAFVEA